MTVTKIPDAFVNIIGFDSPVAFFPAKPMSRWGNLVVVFVMFSVSGGALIWGAYNAYTRYLKF